MNQRKKNIIAAMMGNALEYYDFTLYGFFAAFLSPLYFPTDNPQMSIIASFGAFAAGFLMRPIGGLIFGHLGDRYGRKTALVLSIMAIALPTLTMGILPTYHHIGVFAPLLLILCRLAQGICTAGEYTGAVVITAEYAKNNQPGFACSLLPTSSLIGAVIGTSMGALCLIEGMPDWAWRVPFILGFIFGMCVLLIRTKLDESPEFIKNHQGKQSPHIPIVEILKHQRWNFICTMGIGATALAPFYIISIYVVSLASNLGLSPSKTMLLNLGVLLIWMIFLPLIGYLSDRIGIRRTMSYGCLLLIFCSIPVFMHLGNGLSLQKIILAQFILSCCGAFFVAPMGAFLTRIFPTSSRYSGIALGLCFGEAVFGGTAPLIAAGVVSLTGEGSAPGFYLSLCAVFGFIAINLAKPLITKEPLMHTHNDISLMPKLNFQFARKFLK